MHESAGHSSVVDWIEDTCRAMPDHVAVTGVGDTLTYGELWSRALTLGADLEANGVERETLVGLWAEQSSDLIVGLVGILIAGGAYVPLDPTYPKSRTDLIIRDAHLELLVAPARLATEAAVLGIPKVIAAPMAGDDSVSRPTTRARSRDAIYVIYTSGSTGTPKGVVVEHRSVLELLAWMRTSFELRPGERICGTASPAFDAAVPNHLLPLVSGATFVALDTPTTWDPYALAAAIDRFGPRILQTSPTMLRMLSETGWTGDRDVDVWVGGEHTPPSVISYIVPRVRSLTNFYGPTEATVTTTMTPLTINDLDAPIGTPPAHVVCSVLDVAGRHVAAGATGELVISGRSLARGYLHDVDLTNQRFVMLDLGDGAPQRCYRTGDLASVRPDGSLLLHGRVDEQVKLRGYRIEPREIELRLEEHPSITEAVVVLQPASEHEEARLVALVKATSTISQRDARAFVRATLPDHMVPAAVLEVEHFPLTPNGKVDTRALVAVAETRRHDLIGDVGEAPVARPTSPLEAQVVSMFATVLSLPDGTVGLDDDFFDLGGTSLRCARLFMLIERDCGATLPLSTLVTAPTPRRLSWVIGDPARHTGPERSGHQPRHEWERIIAQLWQEVLGVQEVTRTDDFFALGGSAQDASRMLDRLRTHVGTEVTLAELRDASTVERLAELVGVRSSRSVLVALNADGTSPPFFCIAGAGGLAVTFLPLARLLGPDQPVYGLQARGIESRARPDYLISQTAARYTRAIRTIQPSGPYLLGGHSLGGVLALTVAHQLRSQGEEVALLAIFDTNLTRRMIGPGAPRTGAAHGTLRQWATLKGHPQLSTVARLPFVGLISFRGIAQFEVFAALGEIQATFARRLEPWDGRAVVFASDEAEAASIEAGWSKLLTGQWSTHRVPGKHVTMLEQSNIAVAAIELREQIAAALRSAVPREQHERHQDHDAAQGSAAGDDGTPELPQ